MAFGATQTTGEHLLASARASYAKKDYVNASLDYKAIPKLTPQYFISREELAWTYLQQGDWSALRGLLVHVNSSLIPLKFRLEARVLSAIGYLHDCDYKQVQQEIQNFQTEMLPYAKKIELVLNGKQSLNQKQKIEWKNQESLVYEAITKMRFVKIELLSQLQRLEKTRKKQNILAETHQIKASSNEVAFNEINNVHGNSWVYPADKDTWSDELFLIRALPNSQCQASENK